MSDTTGTRWLSTVGPPPPAAILQVFPQQTWGPHQECWRTHDDRGPWFFSWHPGRFNLTDNRGTLNTASDPRTAVREYLGACLSGQTEIPVHLIEGRSVSLLSIDSAILADLTADTATTFGVVSGDFSGPASPGYKDFRSWATAFDEAGFDGIYSRSRFGTGRSPACIYFFGPAGAHDIGTLDIEIPIEDVLDQIDGYTIAYPKESTGLSFDG